MAQSDRTLTSWLNEPIGLRKNDERGLLFTGRVYGQGLRADIALRNADPLFTGKNDRKVSVFCP